MQEPTPNPAVKPPPIMDSKTLMKNLTADPKEIIRGLLYKGCKMSLGGSSKTHKSWILIDLALSVAYGIPWLGLTCTQGKVLYLNLEILDHFFTKRLVDVAKFKGIKELNDGCLDIWNLRGFVSPFKEFIAAVVDQIVAGKYDLVILDPVYKLLGDLDENSARDINQLLTALEKVTRQSGCAIIFAAHFSKGNQSGKRAIDRVSGSGVFGRDPDSIVTATEHKDPGAFTIESTLRNHPEKQPFVVEWIYPLMVPAPHLDPKDLKQVGGRAATFESDDVLELLPPEGLRTGEWKEEAVESLGISESSFHRARRELKKQSRVMQDKQLWKPVLATEII
jgi:hypothetical protein